MKNLRFPRAEILFGQPADAAEKIRSYIKKARGRRRTALETCTAADLAQLDGGAMPVNMDKYLTLRYPEPATILDYFDDPLLILEEPASLREAERATAFRRGEELSALLAEMLARLPRPEPVLTVKVSGSDVRLCYRDIISAEHFAHLINIRTTALKTLVTRQSFKVFTEPLKKDPRFFVCGRGMIVNLEHAADFRDGAFCMTDGSSVYVSQELLKPARQAFMEFLLQRERMK